MSITKPRKVPTKDELKGIEPKWVAIASNEASFASPKWHEEELRRTERDFAAGKVEVLDWEDVKKELRRRAG